MARSVLVVEDDHNIADLLRMYLEKEGSAFVLPPTAAQRCKSLPRPRRI